MWPKEAIAGLDGRGVTEPLLDVDLECVENLYNLTDDGRVYPEVQKKDNLSTEWNPTGLTAPFW